MARPIPFRVLLCGAILTGATLGSFAIPAPSLPSTESTAGDRLSGCRVVDGDTLNCAGERIRLLAIDAPEMAGHCRPGRNCAPGDPIASTSSLRDAMTGDLKIQRTGTDRYGRTLALVSGSRGDLSCWQLKARQAIYRDDWDDGGRVASICPSVTREAS